MKTNEETTDMWTSYKDLNVFLEDIVSHPVRGILKQLEEMLRRHKHDFVTLLSNSPKNAENREEIKRALTDCSSLPGFRHQVLTKEIVAETIILSDMFNLHEYVALDLLTAAQLQMPHHPGLSRGLVGVLLYYDAKKSLVYALKTLVQARKGVSWTLHASEEVVRYITWFTDELLDHRLFSRIIDLLETMDLTEEIDLLHQNRAVGGPRHHRQVVDLYQDIRQGLAEILFCWSAQCGLPRLSTLKLISFLKSSKMEDDATGIMDNVTVTITMSFLYALDLSVVHTKEDGEEVVKSLPFLSDVDFIPALMKELLPSEKPWETPGLQGLAHLTWALALCTLRLINSDNIFDVTDEDDLLVDSANELNVFDFIRCTILTNQLIYKEEFFMRRIHTLITDFIVLMPMKVKEMKNRSDESSRTIQAYIQEGLEPPQGLPHHFEHLLLTMSRFYKEDPLKLELALDFWSPTESVTVDSGSVYRYLPRQVALFKFVRLGGDMLPPAIFVPYMKMLQSLASSPLAAQKAFNFLKMNSSGSATVSWNHFFKSLDRYYCNLRQELPPTTDTVYQHRSFPRGILPQEIQGLQAVLGVIRTVADKDPAARVSLCECTQWSPVAVLLGLVTCAVPIPLKAELLLTLAALARTPGPASTLWYSLEASQILTTAPSSSSYQPRGVQTELEEIESRNEEFPLTRALLHLLDVLTDVPVPRLLGIENRPPGFDPYLNFVVNSVFLRFHTRSYKHTGEKWDVAEGCLILMKKFLKHYTPMLGDFCIQHVELQSGGTAILNSPPGYCLMIYMNSKSELLRLVLSLIDEGANTLEMFSTISGQNKMEATVLSCLEMVEFALALQDEFCELLSSSGSSLLVTGLRRLLLDVNPRSGKPDHLLNITRYVTHSCWLPHHALSAVKILQSVCFLPLAQNHLLSLYTSSPELTVFVRHGFVECIEAEEEDPLPGGDPGETVQGSAKEAIFKLMQQCLPYGSPNISHYLLGFDFKKVHRTIFQQPGVLGYPRTCLHSLLSVLDGSLAKKEKPYASGARGPILETAYCMLFLLCSDNKTSGPVLRFLRSCGDFVYRHLSHLPFVGENKTSEMVQMSWLLKIAAVELKAVSRNDQISILTNMVNLLTREVGDAPGDPDNQEACQDENNENLSQYLSRKNDGDDLMAKKQRMLLTLLNPLDFEVSVLPQPDWEFFVPKQLAELSARCEMKSCEDQKLIDVKRMHRIMLEELSALQGNSTAQRSLIVNEIEKVLKFFIEQNKQRAYTHATVFYMDAWRQVTEILFCVCPQSVLPEDVRLGLLVDCLHIVLKKVLSCRVIPELAALASGAILLLSVALQQSLLACQQQMLAAVASGNTSSILTNTVSPDISFSGPVPAYTSLNIPGRPGIFETVLSNILEWVLNAGVCSQKLRTNLYGALLMFVRMVCRDAAHKKADFEGEMLRARDSLYVSRLDSSVHHSPGPESQMRQQACLEVIMGFGEGLIDVLCNDCTGSHDVCKMLALSCLGLLVEFDPHTSWITYINSRGYLRHLIDGLCESDEELVYLLGLHPHTLSSLYVYESKMAMLCRVAANLTGAELLLEQGVFGCLASMTVFDKHPDFKPNLSNADPTFMPTIRSRYQQILFPALDLCDAVLTTMGPDHQTCCAQIQYFLYSHYEMLSIILRCGSPLMQTKFLKEVARITGIIARVSHHDAKKEVFEDSQLPLGRHHKAHVQTWMLELMRHFLLSENIMRELRGTSTTPSPEVASVSSTKDSEQFRTDFAFLHFLQVACNLMLFARNIIASRGLDRRATQPIFSLQIEEIPSEAEEKKNEGKDAQKKRFICPPLGLVIEQLVLSVSCHQREKANLDLLQHKKVSLSTAVVPVVVSEVLLDSVRDGGDSAEGHVQTCDTLDKQIEQKRLELEHCAFLVDNCLYLIWCHLDFYLYQGALLRKGTQSTITPAVSERKPLDILKVTKEDISSLKEGLVSTFNDTFSKKLLEIHQDRSATDKGFIEALLKRIKRLIQFASTDERLP